MVFISCVYVPMDAFYQWIQFAVRVYILRANSCVVSWCEPLRCVGDKFFRCLIIIVAFGSYHTTPRVQVVCSCVNVL